MTARLTRLRDRRGFTLVELIVVVFVIGILVSIVIPNFRRYQLRAQAADVATRVEAIAVAIRAYETDYQSLPVVTGPTGAAPAFLRPYLARNFFSGPGAITIQLLKPDPTAGPSLVISASTQPEQQVLLAAASSFGSIASVLGGGATLLISLSN